MPLLGHERPPQLLTRREFLYYLWAASLALFSAESGGALLWYALPRFKPGEFGGRFTIPIDQLPKPDSPPVPYFQGQFWLVNAGPKTVADSRHPPGYAPRPGLLAIYKVCVHLGCLYQWKDVNDRFECPCHGSKYLKDGTRIRHPAARDLDKFLIEVVDANGAVLAATVMGEADGDPDVGQSIVVPAGAVALIVDTGKRVRGRANAGPDTVTD